MSVDDESEEYVAGRVVDQAAAGGADRADDEQVESLFGRNRGLGLVADWGFKVGTAALEPGDVLAVFTDGATEITGPDGEETARLSMLGRKFGDVLS